MATPKLETKRLILREIDADDVDAIFNCWMRDEDVSRYMYWKASDEIKDTKEFVEFELGNIENDEWNRWIIILKETSEIIGTCLIYFNEDENSWDISYNLGKRFWGKGYITEAMNRVMKFAKDDLNIQECIAIHATENPASGRVIQKLGFCYEKDVPYECSGGDIVTTGKYYRYRYNGMDGVVENKDMTYELAVKENIQEVYNVVQQTIKLVYPKYYPEEVVDFFCALHNKEAILKDIQSGYVSVLKVDGKIAGTGCFVENHITRVYVCPEYQKKGYGTFMIKSMEEEIAKKYNKAYLDASLPAASLYEKLGYVTVKHEKYPVENGAVLAYEIMEKQFIGGAYE